MIIAIVISVLTFVGVLNWAQQHESQPSTQAVSPTISQQHKAPAKPTQAVSQTISAQTVSLRDAQQKTVQNTATQSPAKSDNQQPDYHPLKRVLSPDMKKVVTADVHGKLRIWDMDTEGFTEILSSDNKAIECLCISPDGQTFAAGSWDKTARVWDMNSGQAISPPIKHDEHVADVIFTASGQRILTLSDRKVQYWDIQTGKRLAPVIEVNNYFNDEIQLSADGKIVYILDKMHAWGWDIQTAQPATQQIKTKSRRSACRSVMSHDQTRIGFGLDNNSARIWDTKTGKPISPEFQMPAMVLKIVFSPDDRYLMLIDYDYNMRIWDLRTFKPVMGTFEKTQQAFFIHQSKQVLINQKHQCAVWDIQTGKPVGTANQIDRKIYGLTADEKYMVELEYLFTKKTMETGLWDINTMTRPLTLPSSINAACFTHDGKQILTVGYKTTRLWDRQTGKPDWPQQIVPTYYSRPLFSPDGQKLLLEIHEDKAQIYDVKTGKQLTSELLLPAHKSDLFFTNDSEKLIAAQQRIIAKVWDANTGKVLREHLHAYDKEYVTNRAAVSPDGKYAITHRFNPPPFGERRTSPKLERWDMTTGRYTLIPIEIQRYIDSIRFSPDGMHLAIGYETPRPYLPAFCVWDMNSFKPLFEPIILGKFHAHQLQFSENGQWVCLNGSGAIRIFEVATGQQMAIKATEKSCEKFTFSPDSQSIAMSYWNNTVRVWDVQTDTPVGPQLKHPVDVTSVAISPDGKWLLTGCDDGQARLWDIKTGKCRDYYKDLVLKLGQSF